MKYLRHASASFILFAMMVALWSQSYVGLETSYNTTRTGDHDGYNVMEGLDRLLIITSMNQTLTAAYKVQNPASVTDLLGAFAAGALGILEIIAGIFLLPLEIIGVITGFYYIPPIISVGLFLIITNYVIFILLSNRSRGEL